MNNQQLRAVDFLLRINAFRSSRPSSGLFRTNLGIRVNGGNASGRTLIEKGMWIHLI